ncbi:MAG TPA: zinc-ribbon domain-containing protein [Phycisphaerae bacterium]|jgi:predicted amidophosphoribosyltransferase
MSQAGAMDTCWNCGATVPQDAARCPNCRAALPGDQPVKLHPASNRVLRGIAWGMLILLASGAIVALLYLLLG